MVDINSREGKSQIRAAVVCVVWGFRNFRGQFFSLAAIVPYDSPTGPFALASPHFCSTAGKWGPITIKLSHGGRDGVEKDLRGRARRGGLYSDLYCPTSLLTEFSPLFSA